jgi:hypothetical protein
VIKGNNVQPKRIGDVETAEWQELFEFYQKLERRERQPKVRALALAAMCVPVVVGMLNLVH